MRFSLSSAQYTLASTYSAHQLTVDALSYSFSDQATQLKSLAAMSAASLAFTGVRSLAFSFFSNFSPLRVAAQSLAWSTALFSEVASFRAIHQTLNPSELHGSIFDADIFALQCLDFSLMKGFQHLLKTQNYFLRHGVSASAMMAGASLQHALDLNVAKSQSFGEGFAQALSSSIAMEAGNKLSSLAIGGRAEFLQRRVSERTQQRALSRYAQISTSRLPQMASMAWFRNVEPALAKDWNNVNIAEIVEAASSDMRAQPLMDYIAYTHPFLFRTYPLSTLIEMSAEMACAARVVKFMARLYPENFTVQHIPRIIEIARDQGYVAETLSTLMHRRPDLFQREDIDLILPLAGNREDVLIALIDLRAQRPNLMGSYMDGLLRRNLLFPDHMERLRRRMRDMLWTPEGLLRSLIGRN